MSARIIPATMTPIQLMSFVCIVVLLEDESIRAAGLRTIDGGYYVNAVCNARLSGVNLGKGRKVDFERQSGLVNM